MSGSVTSATEFSYRHRKVRERRREEGDKPAEPQALADFADASIIVLLGEPGLGKTRSFRRQADNDEAKYLTVSRFLAMRSLEPLRGKTLYLDALDEYRAKSADGRMAVDELVGRLEELAWPKLRLSCRAIDWRDGDAAKLAEAAQGGKVVVVDLLPLTDDDILAMVHERRDDPQAFIDGAKARGLDTLLGNPELLDLLLIAYGPERRWPDNRCDLFERALAELMKETNPEHETAADPPLTDLTAAADRLMAIALLANRDGFAMRNGQADDMFTVIGEASGDAALMRQAAGRRVFSQSAPGKVEPRHRTVAEFMAARHLRDRIYAPTNPLSLNRVLALLTGGDGGTFPDTRGVFAWLATLLTGGDAARLVACDPLGAVLYGDAASWEPATKVAAFAALRKLADRDPWFRHHENRRWERPDDAPFGGLACPELVPAFRQVLRDDNRHHLVSTVLDILKNGPALPELGDDLLDLARNTERDVSLRVQAVDAFAKKVAPDRLAALVEVLNDVRDGRVTDESFRLRSLLLRCLYPALLQPEQIPSYLNGSGIGAGSGYGVYLSHYLLPETPVNHLVRLADAFANLNFTPSPYFTGSLSNFIRGLLNRIVTELPAAATPERLWRWLGIGLGKIRGAEVPYDVTPALFDLMSQPDIFCALFDHWFDCAKTADDSHSYGFFHRLKGFQQPLQLTTHVLHRLEHATNDIDILLNMAIWINAPLEKLFTAAVLNPIIWRPLQQRMWENVPKWRSEDAKHRFRQQKEDIKEKQKRIKNIAAHIDHIRSGAYAARLSNPAHWWLIKSCTLSSETHEFDKFAEQFGPSITDAYLTGFKAILLRDDLPTPQEIGALAVEGRGYYASYPVQAGMALTTQTGWENVLALPEATLRAAICFAVADHVGSPDWFDRLLSERADLAGKALYDFWRACFEADGAACPKGLNWQRAVETFAGALGVRALDLLREFPNADTEALNTLLTIAAGLPDVSVTLDLIRSVLDNPQTLSPAAAALWAAAGYRLDPGAFAATLESALAASPKADWELDERLIALGVGGSDDRKAWRLFIRRLTACYVYVESERDGWVTPLMEALRAIPGYIEILATDPSPETSKFLAEMRDDPARASWRDHFAHAAGQQAQRRRQAEYAPPNVAQVVQTLNGGAPANIGDLQALTMDLLTDIKEEMRNGAADGWKICWNTDSHGAATNPKIENVCRDFLLGHLNSRLKPFGATAKPEARYADDKRADIDVTCASMVLPIEIKRQMHDDIWTAPADQLDRQYARDPVAGGRGVYLAFWFGQEYPLKPPPDGGAKPTTAAELQAALEKHLPTTLGQRITVIVFDVAKPEPAPVKLKSVKSKPVKPAGGTAAKRPRRRNAPPAP